MLGQLFSIAFAAIFALTVWLGQPVTVAAVSLSDTTMPVAVLPGLKGVFTGTRPVLGVDQGQLTTCPSTDNCVVSRPDVDADHSIAPITYTTDRRNAYKILLSIIKNQPRVEVVEQSDDYIYVEFTSRLMGFVDDAEFYFPTGENIIQMRSAARLGESDLGVNRRRLEQFRLAMATLGA